MEELFDWLCDRSTNFNQLEGRDLYNSILVIVNWLTKMVYYKLIKITINAPGLAKVIIDVIICHYSFPNSNVTNRSFFFTSKFWSLLCYFLSIKRWLLNTFYPQIDSQTKKQNSTIKAYLWAFVNFKQNNWATFLLMAKFAYNNNKNVSTDHTFFKLNCGDYSRIVFQEDNNPYL